MTSLPSRSSSSAWGTESEQKRSSMAVAAAASRPRDRLRASSDRESSYAWSLRSADRSGFTSAGLRPAVDSTPPRPVASFQTISSVSRRTWTSVATRVASAASSASSSP